MRLEVVCWLWTPAVDYRSQFSVKHVNILRRMVERYYPHPHRFSCISDQTEGFDSSIRVIPLWNDYRSLPSLYGPGTPSCYPRLKAFDGSMESIIGERFVSVDLDCVLVNDMSPVWYRPEEEFIIWGDRMRRTPYNGSMWLMRAGVRQDVWTRFQQNPDLAIRKARGAGFYGSDQAWMNYALKKDETRWTTDDGVFSFRQHVKPNDGRMPSGARIVFFEGMYDPWNPVTQKFAPWIAQHYC